MESIPGFIRVLQKKGYKACMFTVNEVVIKRIRKPSVRFTFDWSKKARKMAKKVRLKADLVYSSDIDDVQLKYYAFEFIPWIAPHFCHRGHMTVAADSAHNKGFNVQTYGMTYEVLLND